MDENRYTVAIVDGERVVEVTDPQGAVVLRRACGSEDEAAAFASTVRQHVRWLSEGQFREYYRLPDPGSD